MGVELGYRNKAVWLVTAYLCFAVGRKIYLPDVKLLKECQYCGKEIKKTNRECPYCGSDLHVTTRFPGVGDD
jgi:rRNA maturation endonuclease Nob1